MRRPNPNLGTQPPPLQRSAVPSRLQYSFPLQAITPIYKGGSNPGAVDIQVPFRGSSLRGVLRSWWRALQETSDIRTLRDAEHHRFGGVFAGAEAKRQGTRGMRASPIRLGVIEASSRPGDLPDRLQYVTWVDRPNARTGFTWHHEAKARLLVSAPVTLSDIDAMVWKADLEQALQAMLLLGGIGSRSRRGMGALETEHPLVPRPKDGPQLVKMLEAIAPSARPRPWPSLGGATVVWGSPVRNPLDAVRSALEAFRAARGMRQVGSGFEGDQRIKAIQQDWLALRDGGRGFRGTSTAFGLPLAWRSKNGHLKGPTGQDMEVMLQAHARPRTHTKVDRLPSPVLIRPVRLSDNQYLPVLLVLRLWADVEFTGRAHVQLTGRPNPATLDLLVDHLKDQGWSATTLGRTP